MPFIKLSATEKRRVTVFVTCLVLAVLAWLLIGLNSFYNFKVKGILIYRNTPQVRAFHALQSDTVEVTLQGTGWQMLFSRMGSSTRPIPVDLHTLEHQNYLVISNQLQRINNDKDVSQKLIMVSPDTLYFDFTKRMSKRVPVTLISSVAYEQQYAPYNAIILKPGYVIVSGPGNLIAGINSWNTDSLKLTDVDETVNTHINLLPPKEGNISIYPKTVQVHIPVDEFTEKTLEVPVKLINNPHYYNVKLFPQKVKVTFTTSLKRYKETSEDFFEATADLQLWEKDKSSVLPVNLTRLPAFCRVVRVEPRNIDFIIKK